MTKQSIQSTSSMAWPYKDAKRSIECRVDDLISRMTIPEKAGLLFQDMIVMGPGGQFQRETHFGIPPADELIGTKHMSHFNLLGSITNARETAQWYNKVQERAIATRLGIPVTISSDPRNHFTENVGTGFHAGVMSQWPEPLGLAALRSTALVERFADIARREYLALGMRLALHPQIDLATEPRWARLGATFGECAELSSKMAAAYIRGFQGSTFGPESVSTMTKHFPGCGPQKDGEDPHFTYGKEQVYPGDHFEYHLQPFRSAISSGASQMMICYGVPLGTKYEEIGFAFNRDIVTCLLREELGFSGIICTDWGLITDVAILGQHMPARAWGAEHLSEIQRVQRLLEAGCDQLGGESRPELVVSLVDRGLVPESRIDESVRRILREKFALGLFDSPFVDAEAAHSIVGNPGFIKEGQDAQRRAFTLLTNDERILPLSDKNVRKVYLDGIDPAVASARGLEVVDDPTRSEVALMRLKAPSQPRPGGFEKSFHCGSLEFPVSEKNRQAAVLEAVPTVVDIYLDRPAIFPEIVTSAAALLVSYGSSDDAFLDVVFGKASPEGKLPFDLPSSMTAVEVSRSDVPFDTANPLFRFGHGLRYQA